MHKLLIALVLVGCGGTRWHDKPLQGVMLGAMYLDYKQTQVITANCNETNPIIGKCGDGFPSLSAYFLTAAAVHTVAMFLIPNGKWRTAAQTLSIGIQGTTVYTNRLTGVRIKW